jgi:hypothetical protein
MSFFGVINPLKKRYEIVIKIFRKYQEKSIEK